jgi:hypothetical protein
MDIYAILILGLTACVFFFFSWGIACLLHPASAFTIGVLALLAGLSVLWLYFFGPTEFTHGVMADRLSTTAIITFPAGVGCLVGSRWPKRLR